ncbi:IS66 family insertion sequence element accessory protein TnpB [Pseudomonas sp. PGPR40]|uniref:IS66 family insertion sequence element accessory protein TnpB n=1 Tax=Pseudomonas sp. PGPR40 TaxID=2913476 RepID=UPI0022AAEB6F|nr:IS66 family insertion sequence element accessory protein TnpB [Pseudomonas sp. PGPR40]
MASVAAQPKVLLPARPFFETSCDDSHRFHLARHRAYMRAGTETAFARVIAVFGAAKPHCAYLFANRRATRMKVLMHDGFGIWLAARRLNQGKFHWLCGSNSRTSVARYVGRRVVITHGLG